MRDNKKNTENENEKDILQYIRNQSVTCIELVLCSLVIFQNRANSNPRSTEKRTFDSGLSHRVECSKLD